MANKQAKYTFGGANQDSSKYQEMFNKLSSHIEKEYNYNIKPQNIDELKTDDVDENDLNVTKGLGKFKPIILIVEPNGLLGSSFIFFIVSILEILFFLLVLNI